ncbi:MAG: MFS transporter [Candidatus Pacebacteria bacterium]|nr:MFS transporter [Candidatus Paceibacterota bacterium]
MKTSKQIKKFYLASFLKNQIYFVPIMVLFFQDLGLSYAEIFWIFTIGSVFSFLLEIPTGLISDLYGARRSIILSKFLIFLSFIAFGLSFNFITLLLANLLYELGKSFRSGTETAFVYNYLEATPKSPSYTLVKVNQKFYARLSESLGALLGGFLAYKLGFSWVFLIAALPAFINFIQTFTWAKLEGDRKKSIVSWKNNLIFLKTAFKDLKKNPIALRIIANISLFTAGFVALDKFVQPYMKNVGVELQYFGLIYSAFLIIVAFLVRFASKLEAKVGARKIMNYSSFLAALPLLALGLGLSSVVAVGLFFLVLMIDNVRSPIANTLFHQNVKSENRATMGSILELFKSLNKLWFLPVIGYVADIYSLSLAILAIFILIILNAIFLFIPKTKTV